MQVRIFTPSAGLDVVDLTNDDSSHSSRKKLRTYPLDTNSSASAIPTFTPQSLIVTASVQTFAEILFPRCFMEIKFNGDLKNAHDIEQYKEFLAPRTFQAKITINDATYLFFLYTKNQISLKSCILVRESHREYVLRELGFQNLLLTQTKKLKYAGLLFNDYTPICELQNVKVIVNPDTFINQYCFTDGCGLISPHLAVLLLYKTFDAHGKPQMRFQYPSTSLVQVRLPGIKGVLLADPSLANSHTIIVHPSMVKLPLLRLLATNSDDEIARLPIHMIDFARPQAFTYINHQSLPLFIARGVEIDVVKRRIKEYINAVRYMTMSAEYAVNFLWLKGEYQMLMDFLAAVEKMSENTDPQMKSRMLVETYEEKLFKSEQWMKLVNLQKEELQRWKKPDRRDERKRGLDDNGRIDDVSAEFDLLLRVKLPVAGVLLFGACDTTQPSFLKSGQCFVRLTLSGFKEPVVITGKVAVFRYPCYHPGDIRVLDAVECQDLEHLADVIVFPVDGTRPVTDEMGGGDLDGDKYQVIWDSDFVPKETIPAFDYTPARMKQIIIDAGMKRGLTVSNMVSARRVLNSKTTLVQEIQQDVADMIKLKPALHISRSDTVMRNWQRFVHPVLKKTVDFETILVSLFNVGIDGQDGLPDLMKLANVLNMEILSDSPRLSEVGKLDSWFMDEVKHCFERLFERDEKNILVWRSFLADTKSLWVEKMKSFIEDAEPTESSIKQFAIPTQLHKIAERIPFTSSIESEIEYARRGIEYFEKVNKLDSDVAINDFTHEAFLQRLSVFDSALVQSCVHELNKIDEKIKQLREQLGKVGLFRMRAITQEIAECEEKIADLMKRKDELEVLDSSMQVILMERDGEFQEVSLPPNAYAIETLNLRLRKLRTDLQKAEIEDVETAKQESISAQLQTLSLRGQTFVQFLEEVLEKVQFAQVQYRSANLYLAQFEKVIKSELGFLSNADSTPIYDFQTKILNAIFAPVQCPRKPISNLISATSIISRVILLVSETGSGKSTLAPQFVLNRQLLELQTTPLQRICVAQPRRTATEELATYLANSRDSFLGDEIGFHLGNQRPNINKNKTLLECVTYGILLRKFASDPGLSNYSIIFVDEVHEESMDLYILLGALKVALMLHPGLKVVLMSASVNEERLYEYFTDTKLPERNEMIPPPITEIVDVDEETTIYPNSSNFRRVGIPGKRGFEVTEIYSPTWETNSDQYIPKIINFCMQLHVKTRDELTNLLEMRIGKKKNQVTVENYARSHPDILVFLPKIADISECCEKMSREAFFAGFRDLVALPLYSALDDDEKQLVLRPSDNENRRRIIFATNVAETSLTIPRIGTVIDSGLQVDVKRDVQSGAVERKVGRVSKSSAIQRRGRVGRTAPGICHFLYTKTDFESLQPYRTVKFDNLDVAVLRLISMRQNPFKFPWIEQPSFEDLDFTVDLLHDLGLIEPAELQYKVVTTEVDDVIILDPEAELDMDVIIIDDTVPTTKTTLEIDDSERYKITELGEYVVKISSLGLDCRQARFLIAGYEFDCIDTVTTICAFFLYMQQKPFRRRSGDKEDEDSPELQEGQEGEASFDFDNMKWTGGRDEKVLQPNGCSACSTMVWLYNGWKKAKNKRKFCDENRLWNLQMLLVERLRNDIVKRVEKVKLFENFYRKKVTEFSKSSDDTFKNEENVKIEPDFHVKREESFAVKNQEFVLLEEDGVIIIDDDEESKPIADEKTPPVAETNVVSETSATLHRIRHQQLLRELHRQLSKCLIVSFFTNVGCNPKMRDFLSKGNTVMEFSMTMISQNAKAGIMKQEVSTYGFEDVEKVTKGVETGDVWNYICLDIIMIHEKFIKVGTLERVDMDLLMEYLPNSWHLKWKMVMATESTESARSATGVNVNVKNEIFVID